MDTNPQSLAQIALLAPLMVGALATVCSIIIHGAIGRSMILVVTRVLHREWSRPSFIRDASIIAGAAMMLLSAHLVEILLWAAALMICGEFHYFGPACYHSAMNYSTLGYGDIVMSPQWRFMGPLEALNGMLLMGLTTAILFTVVQQVSRRSLPQATKDLFGV